MAGPQAVSLSGNIDIDALLTGYKWDTNHLTYSFPDNGLPYVSEQFTNLATSDNSLLIEYAALSLLIGPIAAIGAIAAERAFVSGVVALNGFQEFNDAEKSAARDAIDQVSAFTQLTFAERGEGLFDHAVIRFAETGSVSRSFGIPPLPRVELLAGNGMLGDVWLTNDGRFDNPQLGAYSDFTILHEFGHALGLKHGHETGLFGGAFPDWLAQALTGVNGPVLPTDHNSFEYSVMTYSQFPGDDPSHGDNAVDHPTTYMQDDIAALQYMYGANYGASAHNGNTIYSWSATTGEEFIDGVGQGSPQRNSVLMTVWDGGGTDTYDFSNYTTNLSIDLNPGAWTILDTSTCHLQRADLGNNPGGPEYFARGNIANAQIDPNNPNETSSLIENAIGGSGNDTILGNSADNVLQGNGGNDTIDGSCGTNTAVYSGVRSDYTITLLGSGWIQIADNRSCSPDGTDTDKNIQFFKFADKTYNVAELLNPVITAGDLTDHNVGRDDVLIGAPNSTNVLYGDAGGSLLDHAIGGNDTLIGGTNSTSTLYGDAVHNLLNRAIGGNDTLATSGPGNLYGDVGGDIADHAAGGNDILTAQPAVSAPLATSITLNMFGDAGGNVYGRATGGDDTLSALLAANITSAVLNLYGDAGGNISDHAVAGNDTLNIQILGSITPGITVNAFGDAGGDISNHALGGNDTFSSQAGSDTNLRFFGDAGGSMFDHTHGGNDSFTLSGVEYNDKVYGEAGGDISGHANGGNDILTIIGIGPFNFFYGDAGGNMTDHAKGGDDILNDSGLVTGLNVFYGDAGGNMSGFAQGGNDTFNKTAGEGSATFYGDAAGDMFDHAHGGDDTFQAGGLLTISLFYGDTGGNMGDHAVGGDDTYIGGNAAYYSSHTPLLSRAYGDALTMSGYAQGGNDSLTGGDDPVPPSVGIYDTILVGDAQTMSGKALGGNDKLISGTGNDDMWGDAQVMLGLAKGGNDTFVFNFKNGHDKIEDFGQGLAGAGSNWGTDHIDVSALGITDFSQLNISGFDPTTHESTITFSQGDVVVHSQEAVRPQDFIFAPHDFLLS